MKYLLSLLGLLFIISCANQPEAATNSVINLAVTNSNAPNAMVRNSDGFSKEMSFSENGTLTDTLTLAKNGYYQLIVGRESTSIYLEKGKNISVSLDGQMFDESLTYTGDLAAENNYIAAKYLFDEKFDFKEVYSKEEAQFLETIQKLHQGKLDLLTNAGITNTDFVTKETNELTYDNASNLESYVDYHMYFTKKTAFTVTDNFYEPLASINYADTSAFRNSNSYAGLLNVHYNRIAQKNSDDPDFNSTVAFLSAVNDGLPNGYAKEALMTNQLQFGLRPDEGLDAAYSIYKNSAPSAKNLATVTARYEKLSTITKGKTSPAFDYENFAGGKTSLSDLKGKYVYIDVWATWCGPCIREIPSLKILEADYHDANIAFVSISIDEQKDYEKWRKMIPEKELGGIQLMANNAWKSEFITAYAINGIPRFIVLDTEGNIVSADAPRPSDPKLRTLLDELI